MLAAESPAPQSAHPRFTTTEATPGQEWTVVVTGPVPPDKFERIDIHFHIRREDPEHSRATVPVERIFAMFKGRSEPWVARRHRKRLAAGAVNLERAQDGP